MGGWPSKLARKPRGKRFTRVSNPGAGEIEASLVNFIRWYTTEENLGDKIAELRQKYGGVYVGDSIADIREIYGIAEQDLRTAFVVSQRKGPINATGILFRKAFPEYVKEHDDMDLALEIYVRYYLDDRHKRRIEVSAQNVLETHGGKSYRWLRAIGAVYRRAGYDRVKAFEVSQGKGWKTPVGDLFRKTFPDLAADYDKRLAQQGGGGVG